MTASASYPQKDLVKELRLQAALAREERAKTDALFLSIGHGVIAADEHGKIIRVNQAALKLLGFKKQELIGKWFTGTIVAVREDNSPVEVLARPITQAFLSGQTISESMFYLRKDGSRVPVAVTVSPILLRNRPVGAIEIMRDTSLELQSDRMKTDFISIASHQLRTPLSAINTYSHMLSSGYVGPLSEDQASFMKIILSAVDRMNELISALLNITRIEAGSITVESEPTAVDVITKELITELKPSATEKSIKLTYRSAGATPEINSDTLLVKEIISNLLSNAIKYTPEKGSVNVSLKSNSSSIVFSVADTGYGIPASAKSLIFTKFFRADNILKTEVSGTGLGLYLIKILADHINGEVWFDSKENKGSIFYFSLPLKGSPAKTGSFRIEGKKP
ncbi:MAG TPA: ATP-binding protein [Candidatus Binatia bacterium]|nr:ATP-binding protein [Candidatus Binatia bacterium]